VYVAICSAISDDLLVPAPQYTRAAAGIALWLGHESVETTQMYLDADLAMKERALARLSPIQAKATRFRPRDRLLAFLEGL
jgi:hypothetical protein